MLILCAGSVDNLWLNPDFVSSLTSRCSWPCIVCLLCVAPDFALFVDRWSSVSWLSTCSGCCRLLSMSLRKICWLHAKETHLLSLPHRDQLNPPTTNQLWVKLANHGVVHENTTPNILSQIWSANLRLHFLSKLRWKLNISIQNLIPTSMKLLALYPVCPHFEVYFFTIFKHLPVSTCYL